MVVAAFSQIGGTGKELRAGLARGPGHLKAPQPQDRGHTRLMGGLHHVAREASFEAKESDESRNSIGSRRGAVAGGRRVRSSRWSVRRYTDGQDGNYSR
jgi:hypothetical protein